MKGSNKVSSIVHFEKLVKLFRTRLTISHAPICMYSTQSSGGFSLLRWLAEVAWFTFQLLSFSSQSNHRMARLQSHVLTVGQRSAQPPCRLAPLVALAPWPSACQTRYPWLWHLQTPYMLSSKALMPPGKDYSAVGAAWGNPALAQGKCD